LGLLTANSYRPSGRP